MPRLRLYYIFVNGRGLARRPGAREEKPQCSACRGAPFLTVLRKQHPFPQQAIGAEFVWTSRCSPGLQPTSSLASSFAFLARLDSILAQAHPPSKPHDPRCHRPDCCRRQYPPPRAPHLLARRIPGLAIISGGNIAAWHACPAAARGARRLQRRRRAAGGPRLARGARLHALLWSHLPGGPALLALRCGRGPREVGGAGLLLHVLGARPAVGAGRLRAADPVAGIQAGPAQHAPAEAAERVLAGLHDHRLFLLPAALRAHRLCLHDPSHHLRHLPCGLPADWPRRHQLHSRVLPGRGDQPRVQHVLHLQGAAAPLQGCPQGLHLHQPPVHCRVCGGEERDCAAHSCLVCVHPVVQEHTDSLWLARYDGQLRHPGHDCLPAMVLQAAARLLQAAPPWAAAGRGEEAGVRGRAALPSRTPHLPGHGSSVVSLWACPALLCSIPPYQNIPP